MEVYCLVCRETVDAAFFSKSGDYGVSEITPPETDIYRCPVCGALILV